MESEYTLLSQTDNSYILFNRQPSLHKMSMMSHRIKLMDYSSELQPTLSYKQKLINSFPSESLCVGHNPGPADIQYLPL